MQNSVRDAEKADTSSLEPALAYKLLAVAGLSPNSEHRSLKWPFFISGISLLATDISAAYLEHVRWAINDRQPLRGQGFSQRIQNFRSKNTTHHIPSKATKVQHLQKLTKWTGRAGYALTFAVASWEEWNESGNDSSLNTSERVGHSVTIGTTTMAGAIAGAKAGAVLGGTIGSIFPGPGTAIGAVVGGFVGGLAGSYVGRRAGDQVKDIVSEITSEAVDIANDVGDAAGSLASDTTHTLGFWD